MKYEMHHKYFEMAEIAQVYRPVFRYRHSLLTLTSEASRGLRMGLSSRLLLHPPHCLPCSENFFSNAYILLKS